MSYATGLGYDVLIETPFGQQTVTFDLDLVAKDVSDAIIAEAWPKIESRTYQAIPGLVNAGVQSAKPHALKAGLLLAGVITASVYVGARLARGGRSKARGRQPAFG